MYFVSWGPHSDIIQSYIIITTADENKPNLIFRTNIITISIQLSVFYTSISPTRIARIDSKNDNFL